MKKYLLVVASALLFASCAKESKQNELFSVSIVAGIEDQSTKGTGDIDGEAKKINHWVLEVRDANGNLFAREERNDVEAGTESQTFNIALVKDSSYSFQFWADTKGAYVTDDLTSIRAVDTVANKDSRDAFSAHTEYTPSKGNNIQASLYRPFAQLNIITTDLDTLWTSKNGASDRTEYDSLEPKDLSVTISSIPTTFNVMTQEAGDAASVTLTAANVYTSYQSDGITLNEHNNFYNPANKATLFMDYIFADAQTNICNINFTFTSDGKSVEHSFTTVPYQRNFRTNIVGKFLTIDN